MRSTAPALWKREQHSRRWAYCQNPGICLLSDWLCTHSASEYFFLALSRTVPYTLIARANLYTERMILYGNTDCWPTEPRGYGTRCRTGAAPAWHASRDLPAGQE